MRKMNIINIQQNLASSTVSRNIVCCCSAGASSLILSSDLYQLMHYKHFQIRCAIFENRQPRIGSFTSEKYLMQENPFR
jgi:hypothetical protein